MLAGLTGAIVVLPQGVAFATIAGMPPVYGLYAGMIPAIVAAFFGSSWHLVSGPTTAASIVIYSLLSTQAEPGSAAYVQLALTMTFLVGLTQLGLGWIRMGTLVNFISHSVVIGFTTGAAFLIASSQIHNFFGIDIPRGSDFIQTLLFLIRDLKSINLQALAVSGTTLLVGILCRVSLPRVPYMIVSLMAGSLLAWVLEIAHAGQTGLTYVGTLPASLPPLSMPDLSLDSLRILAPGVIAVTLLALTEAISIAQAMALRSGQTIKADQEFIAQGLSNLAGSFFSSYVATGSFNRTGLNYESGARTPIAAASSGLILIFLVTLVAPMAAVLPNAAMAGVLFLVAWGLIDRRHIRQTFAASRPETAILIATFLATLFFNLEIAILFGVMLSLGVYLSRTSHPVVVPRIPDPDHPRRRFTTLKTLPECPQLRIVRVDGSIFFAAISSIREQLDALASPRTHLVIIASGINFIDLSGAEFLAHEAEKRRRDGGGLYLVRVKEIPYKMLNESGFLEKIGRDHLFKSKSEAIQSIFSRLDHDICSRCSFQVFQECCGIAKLDQSQLSKFSANQAA
ncbi:MAG: SulP family inorganic anion transporter [Magnetococcales bacterium]|nr:SulP family inorganic anion transporter [Magnetococcales bacterium]